MDERKKWRHLIAVAKEIDRRPPLALRDAGRFSLSRWISIVDDQRFQRFFTDSLSEVRVAGVPGDLKVPIPGHVWMQFGLGAFLTMVAAAAEYDAEASTKAA